jgi:hypothetical protein
VSVVATKKMNGKSFAPSEGEGRGLRENAVKKVGKPAEGDGEKARVEVAESVFAARAHSV